jgi:hypothetical protein
MSGQNCGATTVCSGMEFDHPGGNVVPEMTIDDLAQHLEVLAQSSEDERDQLLHDLLVQVYPTKSTQDS